MALACDRVAAGRGGEDEIRAAVEALAVRDTELSARLLYRRSRALMRGLGVRSPAELYDILQRVFGNAGDDGVRFADHLCVAFGAADRGRQVRDYVACHPGEPKSVLAMGYEREYGFSAGIAQIWIDLFAEVEDVTTSEWLSCKNGGEGDLTSMTLDAGAVGAACAAAAGGAAGEAAGCERTSTADFFARELHGGICDAVLVRRRFAYEVGDADFVRAIEDAGYYEDQGLLFRCGQTPNEHFTRLILDHPSFARGDAGFEGAVWNHQRFRYVLNKMLKSHTVLLYEPDSYLAFTRLHDVLGVRLADIESYATSVSMDAPEHVPFTVVSLHAGGLCTHTLDALEMPDAFYEGLLEASGLFDSCVVVGTRVFRLKGEGRMSANSLIEWLVARNEGIERDELPRLLRDELGIHCPTVNLTTIIHNSSVYYDDIGDAYYSSIEAWKKEARNELA